MVTSSKCRITQSSVTLFTTSRRATRAKLLWQESTFQPPSRPTMIAASFSACRCRIEDRDFRMRPMKSDNPRLLNFDAILSVNRCESVAGAYRLASRASIFSMARLSALALSAALVIGAPLLHAQRGGGMSGAATGGMGISIGAPVGGTGAPHGGPSGTPNGANGHPGRGIVGGHHRGGLRNNNRASGNNVFLGSPYWGYWGDDGEEVVYEQPPAQPAEGAPVVEQRIVEPSRPPAEPLIIEWQGDRYVRSGGQIPGAPNRANNVVAQRDYSEAPRSASSSQSSSRSLPPA